jgi:hypothetical protein
VKKSQTTIIWNWGSSIELDLWWLAGTQNDIFLRVKLEETRPRAPSSTSSFPWSSIPAQVLAGTVAPVGPAHTPHPNFAVPNTSSCTAAPSPTYRRSRRRRGRTSTAIGDEVEDLRRVAGGQRRHATCSIDWGEQNTTGWLVLVVMLICFCFERKILLIGDSNSDERGPSIITSAVCSVLADGGVAVAALLSYPIRQLSHWPATAR